MGGPKQGSTAWYAEAADKLQDFTKKAKAHLAGDENAFSEEVVVVEEENPKIDFSHRSEATTNEEFPEFEELTR